MLPVRAWAETAGEGEENPEQGSFVKFAVLQLSNYVIIDNIYIIM